MSSERSDVGRLIASSLVISGDGQLEVGFWVFLVSLKGGSSLDQNILLSQVCLALLLQCRGGSVSLCV